MVCRWYSYVGPRLELTREDLSPKEVRNWYHERTQIMFVLLAYSLLRAFLKERARGEINEQTANGS